MSALKPIFLLSEEHAMAGGAKAGAYLDSIGQTDLRKLNAEQWKKVCTLMVGGAWQSALDSYITACEHEAPF